MANEIKEKKFKVERVVYYDSRKHWGVLGLESIDDLGKLEAELLNVYGSISANGSFEKPYENAEVLISGDIIVDPRYGKQILVRKLEILHDVSSKEGIINYLAKGEIEGIGIQLAEKIYEFFGDDTLDIVTNETERLIEVYGIGEKTVKKVKGSVTFLKQHKATIDFLTKLGISYGVIMNLIDEFGSRTIEVVSSNPYEILDITKELSFNQVDEIFLKSGGSSTDPVRLKTAFLCALKRQAIMEGSTGCVSSTLSKKFYSLLDLSGAEDFYVKTATALEGEKKIVIGIGAITGWMGGHIYYKEYLDIEKEIAEKIKALEVCNAPSKKIDKLVVEEEIKNFPFELNKQQVKAIHECLENNVVVLTGSAGCLTGDTIIKYNRAKTGRKGELKNMYISFHKAPVKGSSGWDRSIPTKVRSYISSENRVKLNDVEDIVYSGKKDVYCLTLADGKTLKATIDHQIMTKDGFVQLKNLKKGSLVMVENFTWRQKKENGGRTPFPTQEVSVGKFHPYAKKTRVDGVIYYSLKIHRAIYEANMNGVSLEEFREGCKCPNNFKFIDPSVYHVHHIDHNHWNNDINNLTVMPRKEHYKEYAKGAYSHFEQGVPEFSPVVSIEYVGVEDTYDICCHDHHNFVANGIIVHNSGKSSIMKALYRVYTRCGFNVVLLSATAKACRRLEECTGGDAFTIHKFLGMSKEGYCENDADYPANTVIIIDEASMMDIMLFNELLKRATMSTRFILVGDNNQLPSVQAGNVLGDVIDSKKVEVATLTDIMRQQENSNIIKYCSLINKGTIFEPCEFEDFVYEEFGTSQELREKFLPIYKKEVKEYGLAEVQVISPYKKVNLV